MWKVRETGYANKKEKWTLSCWQSPCRLLISSNTGILTVCASSSICRNRPSIRSCCSIHITCNHTNTLKVVWITMSKRNFADSLHSWICPKIICNKECQLDGEDCNPSTSAQKERRDLPCNQSIFTSSIHCTLNRWCDREDTCGLSRDSRNSKSSNGSDNRLHWRRTLSSSEGRRKKYNMYSTLENRAFYALGTKKVILCLQTTLQDKHQLRLCIKVVYYLATTSDILFRGITRIPGCCTNLHCVLLCGAPEKKTQPTHIIHSSSLVFPFPCIPCCSW